MNTERFMSELRDKLISDKFKENFDESIIGLSIYKILDEKDQLQQRIDKAIEYIENNGHGYDITGDGYYSLDEDEQKELLEILKGDTND